MLQVRQNKNTIDLPRQQMQVADSGNKMQQHRDVQGDKIHQLDELQNDNRQATGSFICNTIRRKYKKLGKANNIIEDMKEEYGTYVRYRKAWKAREIALDYMRGEPDDSYQELPAFLNMVTKTNPGSRTDVKTDSENRFLYMFMAFGASIQG